MGRLFHTNHCRPIHSKPRGWLVGANLMFPAPVGVDELTGKIKTEILRFRVMANVVRVKLPDMIAEAHWASRFAGQERLAIKCRLRAGEVNETIYIDGADSSDLYNVTLGRGVGVRQLPAVREIANQTGIASFYKVEYVDSYLDVDGKRQRSYRVVRGAA